MARRHRADGQRLVASRVVRGATASGLVRSAPHHGTGTLRAHVGVAQAARPAFRIRGHVTDALYGWPSPPGLLSRMHVDTVLLEFEGVIADTAHARMAALCRSLADEGIELTDAEYQRAC